MMVACSAMGSGKKAQLCTLLTTPMRTIPGEQLPSYRVMSADLSREQEEGNLGPFAQQAGELLETWLMHLCDKWVKKSYVLRERKAATKLSHT